MFNDVDVTTREGATTRLSGAVLEAFAAGLSGPLLRSDAPEFEAVRKIWNGMIARRPALIARCQGTADVVHAVRFAREHGLSISVRGGGHNIAGLAVCDGGLMIDLSLMKGVWVDPKGRTARAQAGCTLGDLDRETQLHGLAAVLGFVSETGIAGLTLGGGFGYLTRRCGWTCDNLVSVEVVTAEGRLVRASQDENAELFWCLRGGGGNFGVATSFEYRLHPVGPEVFAGAIAWQGDDAPSVLELYRHFTAEAPRELTAVLGLRIAPPAPWLPKDHHGKPVALIFVCHTGDPADGEALVKPLRAHGKPIADILSRRPYPQMQKLLDATQPKGRRYYWKSDYLPGLTPGALEVLAARAGSMPSPHSAILLFHLQGALNELAADHSPAGNRDAAFVANVAGSWEQSEHDDRNIAWVRECWSSLRPFSTGGAYINFQTEDEGHDRVVAAYGSDTLRRLAELKQKYDPDGLFTHTKRLTPPG